MHIRNALALAVVLCGTAAMPLAGATVQAPAQDSARVAPAPSVRDSSVSTNQAGPRLAPRFQTVEPQLDRRTAFGSAPLPQEGGQNTIVISTLALVLILLIVVLLIR